jgi:hypothetical protein
VKVNFKPVIDSSDQLNLRISPTLKQDIEDLKTRGKALGIDFTATIIAHIEELVVESKTQMDALEQSASKSVAKQPAKSRDIASKSVQKSLADTASSTSINGPDAERA